MNIVKFVLGDWSDDGHCSSGEYVCETNKSVDYLRELHFEFETKHGLNIGEIASKFEAPYITNDVLEKLIKAGAIPPEMLEGIKNDLTEESLNSLETTDPFIDVDTTKQSHTREWSGLDHMYVDTDDVIAIWVNCLRVLDSSLEIRISSDTIPTMHFYGVDAMGRHLKVPGYGCFVH